MKYFVTSSGTGVGKTLLTAVLCHQLNRRGEKAEAFKPVISGFSVDDAESDLHVLLQSMGRKPTRSNLEEISAFRFKAPLSPHIAAEREGGEMDFKKLTDYCLNKINTTEGYMFIEGAGGVMSPITRSHTFLDLIAATGIPSLLVVGSYLGAISHALTAFEVLKNKSEIKAIVVSESAESPMSVEETASTIRGFTGTKTVVLSRIHDINCKWERSPVIVDALGI